MSEQEKNAQMVLQSGVMTFGKTQVSHLTAQTVGNINIKGWLRRHIQRIIKELVDKPKITAVWELPEIK